MTTAIWKTWETSRNLYQHFFDQYTIEQLNTIPAGFSNNLIWNIGHIIVAQQSLIYRLSGLEMCISKEMLDHYKPGTRPEAHVPAAAVEELQHLLHSLVQQTKEDYQAGRFVSFTERTTATGFHLGTLEDAFEFNNYHEGMHLGMMMNIRKFL